jgi:hypothetical protein
MKDKDNKDDDTAPNEAATPAKATPVHASGADEEPVGNHVERQGRPDSAADASMTTVDPPTSSFHGREWPHQGRRHSIRDP